MTTHNVDFAKSDGGCVVEVWERSGWHRHRCSRGARMLIGSRIGGLALCRQHAKTVRKRGDWIITSNGRSEWVSAADVTKEQVDG